MTAPNHHWRKFKNVLMQVLTFACAILVVAPLVLIFYHFVKQGFSSINLAFFTQLPKPVGETGGGMANAIVGTFVLLGAGGGHRRARSACSAACFFPNTAASKLNWWIRFAADILERRAVHHLGHRRLWR